MTPQERQLIDDLFEKLSRLENTPRDPEALDAIAQGQRRAPNAVYALVQTVLVQDEALKRAHARIQELEGGPQDAHQGGGGFLDTMREALFGNNPQQPQRGSVPAAGGRAAWNTGGAMNPTDRYVPQQPSQQPSQQPWAQQQPSSPFGGQPQAGGGGGSFLGTAAAAAAGVVGGGLLLSSIRGMMGGGHQQGFAAAATTAAAPAFSIRRRTSQPTMTTAISSAAMTASTAAATAITPDR
jgi:hypothetical protein